MATTSTDLFERLQLDRFCLASRSNTHDPYAIAVVDRCHCWAVSCCRSLTSIVFHDRRSTGTVFSHCRLAMTDRIRLSTNVADRLEVDICYTPLT